MPRPVMLLPLILLAAGCERAGAPIPAEPQTTPQTASPAPTASADAPAAALPDEPFAWEADFARLTLADFVPFPSEADSWTEDGEILRCTGKPRGYLATRESYQNFTWRLDCRFPRPADLQDEAKFKGNTGFLVYITGEPKIWPVCLEVQGKHVQLAAIKENGGALPPVVRDDESARQSARRGVGEWNSLEIVSRDGALSVTLNGTPISSSEPNFLSSGSLGIQAEDHPFEIRRLRVRRDD